MFNIQCLWQINDSVPFDSNENILSSLIRPFPFFQPRYCVLKYLLSADAGQIGTFVKTKCIIMPKYSMAHPEVLENALCYL